MTLREMVYAFESKQMISWNHTASLCVIIANTRQQSKKGKTFKLEDFHPMMRRRKRRKGKKGRLGVKEGKLALSQAFGLKGGLDGNIKKGN